MTKLLPHVFLMFVLVVVCLTPAGTQPVTRYPNQGQPLATRWEWARNQTAGTSSSGSMWIGYSITKQMRRNAFTGTLYSDARRNTPSLCEQLGLDVCVTEVAAFRSMHNFTMSEGTMYTGDEDGGGELVDKEVGILFEVAGTKRDEVLSAVISNFSLHVDLRDRPVLWLGESNETESLTLLKTTYRDAAADKAKRKIITIVGMHTPSEAVVSFLGDILEHGEKPSLRKEAAFWLGQTNSASALKLLVKTADAESGGELREEAVFAISQMDDSIGTDPLIRLARKGKTRDVRTKAMFWLGQKASEKATGTLKEIVENDEDTEIQKSALYALMQSDAGGGVDALITIAKSHKNPAVRKQAIYLLGESEDERALDVLVGILKDK